MVTTTRDVRLSLDVGRAVVRVDLDSRSLTDFMNRPRIWRVYRDQWWLSCGWFMVMVIHGDERRWFMASFVGSFVGIDIIVLVLVKDMGYGQNTWGMIMIIQECECLSGVYQAVWKWIDEPPRMMCGYTPTFAYGGWTFNAGVGGSMSRTTGMIYYDIIAQKRTYHKKNCDPPGNSWAQVLSNKPISKFRCNPSNVSMQLSMHECMNASMRACV